MKRIFTHLFVAVLLVLSTPLWAQSETKIVTVTPSGGSFTRDGSVVTSGWASSWTSSTEPIVTISVGGVNNMNAGTTSGFQMARGQNADSDWTFSVEGYKVVSYSFKFKSAINNQNVTLSATNANGETVTMTSSYSTEQTFSIDCSNASTATFRISGSNYSIIATDLTLTYREPLALTSLEVGQVYRFVNVLYPTYSLNANSATDVNAVTTNETDTKQQWYVEKQDGEYYVLRNLAYGKFLKGNGQSSAWSMSDDYSHDYNKFKLYTSNTDYNTLHTNTLANYAYIHCNSSYNIVGWSNDTTDKGSHWAIKKVDYTTDEIAALLEKAPTTAEAAAVSATAAASLQTLFTDGAGACVTPALGSLSAAQASEAYKALPATLKAMVDKVYSEKTEGVALETAWTEDNANAYKEGWSGEYAKKFRVQMYEPYSIAGDITGFLRMNAHANNDNPTGIYVPGGGVVYVMVEGEIKEGATLRLIDAGSNERITNATTGGYELNTGLNIIRYTGDAGMLYVCYNVDTYDPNGATEADKFPHKLSEYPPLKIHIEGGAINGFYSSCGDYLARKIYEGVTYNEDLWGGVDDDNDWIYMEERANLSVLPIISHRQILLFQLNEENGQQGLKHFLPDSVSVPDTPFSYPQNGETSSWDDYDAYGMDCNTTTGKINIWMETWDRIMHAELATLGLISEGAVNIMNEFYPRWKSDGTKAEIYDMTNAGPDSITYRVFCNGRDYCEYYNHHGVSLGTTTGYMSAGWNAANYNNSTFGELMGMPTSGGLWGPVHEIGHQFQDVFNIRGATEVTNNVFSNAATWYQGISTSRYNGGNLTTTLGNFNSGLPFVDYNIWSMTQLFYKLWLYYHLAGNNTQFYPRFFEMLRVDPLNAKGATATGTESMLKIYEKMCDAAGEDLTEFFRAHGFFVLLDNYAKGDYGITVFTQTQKEVDAAIARVKAKYTKENFAVILINDGAEATLRHDGKTPRSFFDNTANPEYGGVNDFIDGSATTGGAYTATVNNDGTMTMIGEGGIGFLVFDENGKIISFNDNSTFALSDEAKEAILTGNATIVSVGSDINAEPVVAEIDLTAMQKTILGELIAKAQAIIDKIDNTYTKIGFYKSAAVADLAAALEKAKTVYEGVSGYEAAYDLLYAEYKKVEANADARIPFDPSLTYIITNKANTNQTMWVNNELVVRSEGGVDQTADAAKWQFKATASDGVYNIYNKKGYYCPAVVQSTAMTATTTANADALYTLQEMETGVWAIKLSPAAGYRNFHSSWSNVVGWETGSDASRWYLTAVEPNATIADLTELEVYITKTEALLGEVLGDVTYTRGDSIALQTTTEGSAGYIWSNAPHSEGPIANLVDGATNNYFHTDYSSEPPSGSHYIAVDLGAGNTLPRFAFSHTTRSGAQNDFPKSVDVYGSDDNVTYKYLGSASDMPQTQGTFWQFDGMIISSHRYLRFNMHASRGYWHMAEFDIMPVTGFTATVNDAYSATVTVATVTAAMEAMYNGKGVALSMSPEEEDIEAKRVALQKAYKALYAEYETTVNARKQALAQLAENTQELIDQVGSVGFGSNITKLTLTTENLYCNAPYTAQNNSDYSAEYVTKLTDGSATTFLHTDYSGSVAAPHYLRVYLGENSTAKSFKFNYTTRDNGNNCPTTILIEGCNEADGTYTTIKTLTAAADGLPNPAENRSGGVAAAFESSVIPMGYAYRYVRFKVTGVEGGGATFFVMSEFGFSTVEDEIIVNAPYKSVVSEDLWLSSVHTTNSSDAMSTNALVTSVPLLDAQIADQQIAKAALEEAMAKVTVDKAALQELYDLASALYDKMIDENGNVKENYIPATDEQLAENRLTTDLINAAKAALDAAKDKLDNSNSQTDVDDAKAALQEQYDDLLAVEDANVAETINKDALNTLISNAEGLLTTISEKVSGNSNYYAAVDGLALDELNEALNTAQNVATRYYLTEGQYNDALTALQNCYNTTNGVVAADATDRQELTGLIATMKGLLEETTGGAAQTAASLPLQASDKNAPYYIWSNAKSHDSSDVDALLDQNQDGSANTGTFFGTEWLNNPPAEDYIHYLEIDLGAYNVIENLAIDYTTRDSDHANQRPTGLKFLGSNDKKVYTEIHAITTGLATGRCEQWTMPAPIELGKNYRYIRVAVATEAHYFNMSDFNIYASSVATVNEFYSTSNIFDCLPAGLREYFDAKETVGAYVTNDDYNTAKSELQAQIEALQGVIDSNFESRTPLETLVDDTEALIAEVATVDATEQPIALQCTNESELYYIYCNAPGKTNSWESDRGGVAAVIDLVGDEPNVETFLHTTTYSGNDKADDAETLGHYLRVDLGEKSDVVAFKFSYKSRSGHDNDAPKVVIIEGGNTLNDFEVITTVTAENPAAYQSDEITNGKAYRYIRFRVKETTNNSSNPFFSMSHFEMTACMQVAVKEAYTPQLPTSVVAATYKEKVEGDFVATHYAVENTYTEALEALQAAYDNLAAQMLDRSGLNDLIASTNELCGSVNASENPTLYIYNTAELLAETLAAITPASELLEQKVVTKAQYDAVLATLQAAYDKLLFAINHKNVPVELTTDVNNPVLYKIKINRSATAVLEFDGAADATKQVAVASKAVLGNEYQAWYFMQGTDAESYDDVLILPYWNEGSANTTLRLGAASTGNASAAVWAVESDDATKTKQNWYITFDTGNTAEGWWNIRPEGKGNYFSNNGGVNNKMGFWNSSSDDGSEFQFVLDETDYSLSDAYYALLNQYNDCGGEVTYGTIIGTYSEVTGTAYNTAYNTAAALLEAKNSTDAEYEDARTALATAYDGLEYYGGLCRIRSAYTGGYSTNKLIYVNADGNPHFEDATDEYLSKYIWEFVPVQGGYHLKSLHTQSYVTAAGWGAQVVLGDEAEAKLVTVDFLDDENGIVRLNVQGGYPLHAQESGSKLVGYTGGLGTASAWYVEKVEGENINKIKLNISLNTISGDSKSYSTLYSAFPVVLPGGVDAHVITARNENYLSMDAITDAQNRVVPAYTAVILTAEKVDASSAGTITCDALYNDEATVATFDERENLLIGTIKAEYIECADANEWVYTLGKGGSGIAMYKSKKNYSKVENVNDEGTVTSVTYNKVDNTGDHVKLGANKAYLLLGGGSQGTISTYSFQFGGGTTGIDDVDGENPLEGTIYDLHGRKLSEINTPGYYIINGKKTYVSEVK